MDKEKLKSACMYKGKSLRQLAIEMGMTPQNLSNKLHNKSLKDEDYHKIAQVLGAKYVSYFEFPNGTKI